MKRVAHISDVEGSWARLSTFIAATKGLHLDEGERLHVDEDLVFVFGGDAIDRGPWSRRVVRTLLDAKERQPDRVVLLAGNRDLNKLRLLRELAGALPRKAPPEVHALLPDRRADLLRWIFQHTMGAHLAFEMRRTELLAEGCGVGDRGVVDDDVVTSILDDLRPPAGLLFRYLARCQLAFRHGVTLFVHGGFADECLGHVPGRAPLSDLEAWVEALNAFHGEQLARYADHPVVVDGEPDWMPLVLYQAPVRGLGRNPHSVVYGRFGSDAWNNPRLPTSSSLRWLAERGVRRVVVGHTPCGDLPAVMASDEGVEIVVADNSRGRLDCGISLVVSDDAIAVAARTKLDDDSELDVAYAHARGDDASPVGRLTAEGRLVKAVIDDARALLFRCDDGFVLRQTAVPVAALGPLTKPVDVRPPSS